MAAVRPSKQAISVRRHLMCPASNSSSPQQISHHQCTIGRGRTNQRRLRGPHSLPERYSRRLSPQNKNLPRLAPRTSHDRSPHPRRLRRQGNSAYRRPHELGVLQGPQLRRLLAAEDRSLSCRAAIRLANFHRRRGERRVHHRGAAPGAFAGRIGQPYQARGGVSQPPSTRISRRAATRPFSSSSQLLPNNLVC
jgi:hypothetical protein